MINKLLRLVKVHVAEKWTAPITTKNIMLQGKCSFRRCSFSVNWPLILFSTTSPFACRPLLEIMKMWGKPTDFNWTLRVSNLSQHRIMSAGVMLSSLRRSRSSKPSFTSSYSARSTCLLLQKKRITILLSCIKRGWFSGGAFAFQASVQIPEMYLWL